MKKWVLPFLLLFFVFGVGVISGFAQINVGYVLELCGDWKLNGNNDLRQTPETFRSGSYQYQIA